MAAYLINGIQEVVDEPKMVQYVQQAVPTVAQYGGEIVVARRPAETLEGNWRPKLLTILRFENLDRLMAWYNSAEYDPLKHLRWESCRGEDLVIADAP